MNFRKNLLAISSILIVISTSIIGTILHELAHYFAGLILELQPQLHHNYVQYLVTQTEQQKAVTAACGPLFSLVFGIIVTLVSIKYIKPSLWKLFLLWLGTQSLLVFFGYILIAPIAKNGDTGVVFSYLGIPIYLSITLSILSFIFMNWLFSRLANQFIFYKNEETFYAKKNIKQLFLYPILSSIIIITLLSFPIVTWVSLLPTIFMPMTYFSTMGRYGSLKKTDADLVINTIPISLIVTTILAIVVFRILV
jgi:hypothetical protein